MVNSTCGYRSKFSHSEEHTEPGYYRVLLKTYDILAEITATDHVEKEIEIKFFIYKIYN